MRLMVVVVCADALLLFLLLLFLLVLVFLVVRYFEFMGQLLEGYENTNDLEVRPVME